MGRGAEQRAASSSSADQQRVPLLLRGASHFAGGVSPSENRPNLIAIYESFIKLRSWDGRKRDRVDFTLDSVDISFTYRKVEDEVDVNW